ncbi:MAG: hypothetical protein K8E24_004870 [Methanobacterium paludis]|nr:hypothetical protein [Methanobacterium paludis]
MDHRDSNHHMKHTDESHEKNGECVVCGGKLTEEHRMKGEHVHSGMIDDLKKRFLISLLITIPILILSPTIQGLVGLGNSFRFTGDLYLLFALSSIMAYLNNNNKHSLSLFMHI